MQEIWKDIKGFEGLYQVSNYGNVKSIMFRNNITQKKRDKILKQYLQKRDGYKCVSLCKCCKGIQKTAGKYIWRYL